MPLEKGYYSGVLSFEFSLADFNALSLVKSIIGANINSKTRNLFFLSRPPAATQIVFVSLESWYDLLTLKHLLPSAPVLSNPCVDVDLLLLDSPPRISRSEDLLW